MVQALRCRDQGFGVDVLAPISLYLIPNVQKAPFACNMQPALVPPFFLKGLLMIGVGVINEGQEVVVLTPLLLEKKLELCKSLGYIQTPCFKRSRNCSGDDDTLF